MARRRQGGGEKAATSPRKALVLGKTGKKRPRGVNGSYLNNTLGEGGISSSRNP